MAMTTAEIDAFVDELQELQIDRAQEVIVEQMFDKEFVNLLRQSIIDRNVAQQDKTRAEAIVAQAIQAIMAEINQLYDICRRICRDPETLMGSCVKAGMAVLTENLRQLLNSQPIPGFNNNERTIQKQLQNHFGRFSLTQFMGDFAPQAYAQILPNDGQRSSLENEKKKLVRFSRFHRAWNLKPLNDISQDLLADKITQHANSFFPAHLPDHNRDLSGAIRESFSSLRANFFEVILDTDNAIDYITNKFENRDLDSNNYLPMIRAIERIFKDCMDVTHEGGAPRVVAGGRANWYFGPKPTDTYWRKHVEWIGNHGPRLGQPEIELLDETTTEILNLVTDPTQAHFPPTACKGLVVGYVQSGKTANYSALIAKALDCGYKNIIVLTGILENLRKQTQDRLCRDLFGKFPGNNQNPQDPEIAAAQAHFVVSMPNGNQTPLHSNIIFLTGTGDGNGDFKGNSAKFSNGQINIAVTKKNPATLRWCLQNSINARTQPTLIIDDEADQASVALRTRAGFQAAAGINRAVRMLLENFEKASYVAYTATPFANMLTCLKPANFPRNNNGEIDLRQIGGFGNADPNFLAEYAANVTEMASLYPKDFIYSLPDPTKAGYMGSERFFGVPDEFVNLGTRNLDAWNEMAEDEATQIRQVDQQSQNLANTYPSLWEAIIWFLMATAIRKRREELERANGNTRPDLISSMMVHVSAKTVIHNTMTGICKRITLQICQRINQPAFRDKLQNIYNENYHDKRGERLATLSPWEARLCVDVPFDDVLRKLGELFGHIINDADLNNVFNFPCDNSVVGSVRILYDRNAPGFKPYIIVNGGNTLTRGLTLEGLVVSHFTRESKQMDTLLQMGRWFGYRLGYHDLCTVYTTSAIADKFMRLTVVEDMIRKEIEQYRIDGVTPEDVGVRIPLMPDLKICGANRMGDVEINRGERFGKPSQTIIFRKNDSDWLINNWNAGVTLVNAIAGNTVRIGRNGHAKVFENVPLDLIKNFLDNYKTVSNARRFDSGAISNYLSNATQQDVNDLALNNWNVVLMSQDPNKGNPDQNCVFGQFKIKMVNRSRIVKDIYSEDAGNAQTPNHEATIGTLISPQDPLIDIAHDDSRQDGSDENRAARVRFQQYNFNIPLLILYPIWKDSIPEQRRRTNVIRRPLGAAHHILGASILFPPKPPGNTLVDNYAVVRIHAQDDPNDLDQDEIDDLNNQTQAQNDADAIDGAAAPVANQPQAGN